MSLAFTFFPLGAMYESSDSENDEKGLLMDLPAFVQQLHNENNTENFKGRLKYFNTQLANGELPIKEKSLIIKDIIQPTFALFTQDKDRVKQLLINNQLMRKEGIVQLYKKKQRQQDNLLRLAGALVFFNGFYCSLFFHISSFSDWSYSSHLLPALATICSVINVLAYRYEEKQIKNLKAIIDNYNTYQQKYAALPQKIEYFNQWANLINSCELENYFLTKDSKKKLRLFK
jgi:hypothetical protein